MSLTPRNIYLDYTNKLLNKISASDLLIFLIENSKSEQIRLESIHFLKEIGPQNRHVFKFLENLLISDLNEPIRRAAFDVIIKLFNREIKASSNLVKHVIKNENGQLLINLIEFLSKVDKSACKKMLVNKINLFQNQNYIDSLDNEILEKLSFNTLKNIAFNYIFKKSSEALFFRSQKNPLAFDSFNLE